jgi:hypothetical protein
MDNLGRILFLTGMLIAVVLGLDFASGFAWLPWVLVVIGAIVGYMNVSESESNNFLIAGIALAMSATAFSTVPALGDTITAIMSNVMTFVSGAIFVVAVQALYRSGKN